MFEVSIASVVLVVILLYTFRKNIKQVQEELPELASHLSRPVLKGAKQLDLIVTTNCNENTVDLAKRTHAVIEELDGIKIDSIKEAEAYILGLK
jgi:hypothetical protein